MIRYETRKPEPAAIIAARSRRCMRSLEERMADDMLEMAFAGQNVSVETLLERDWTRATIERLFPTAREIARRRAVRQVA